MAEKQIVQKIIEGKNIYEYTGDFGGTLAIVENDPLYEKIAGVLKEAEDLANSMLEERAKNTIVKDSVILSCSESESEAGIKIFSIVKNANYTPDIHGVISINDWLMVINESENSPSTYNVLVYRPRGNIESARFILFNKTNDLVVNFMEVTDGTKYVQTTQIPKNTLTEKSSPDKNELNKSNTIEDAVIVDNTNNEDK